MDADRHETYETTSPWIIYWYQTTDEEADSNGGEGRIEMRCSICGEREVVVLEVPKEPVPDRGYHPQRRAFIDTHQHPGVNRNPLSWEKPLANPAALRDGDLEDALGLAIDRARRHHHRPGGDRGD